MCSRTRGATSSSGPRPWCWRTVTYGEPPCRGGRGRASHTAHRPATPPGGPPRVKEGVDPPEPGGGEGGGEDVPAPRGPPLPRGAGPVVRARGHVREPPLRGGGAPPPPRGARPRHDLGRVREEV